jgi:hypothetical protein
MKQFLILSGLLLASLSSPAKAQTGNAQSRSVTREQLAVGIRGPLSSTNQETMAGLSKALSDSSAPSAAQDLGIGAAIGAVVGIGGGIIASKQKQSVEVDIGTNAYVLLGAVSGAILGALVGLVVHFAR